LQTKAQFFIPNLLTSSSLFPWMHYCLDMATLVTCHAAGLL